MTAKKKSKNQIKTREELVYTLSVASELEHSLCAQYLFTAFSMKRRLDEGITVLQQNQIREWESVILEVARQEMEHLGLVCNMLSAVGGAQHFRRPNLPLRPSYYGMDVVFKLQKFCHQTMSRYTRIEKPDNLDGYNHYDDDEIPANIDDGNQVVPGELNFSSVQELYTTILEGFEFLDKKYKKEGRELFIGPAQAQVDNDTLGIGFKGEFAVELIAVTDLATAKQAIVEIIEQGEGVVIGESGKVDKDSHFYKFRKIRNEIIKLDYEPARDCVQTPALQHHYDSPRGAIIITDPDTRRVLEVFNAGYQIMIQMLIRLYSYSGDSTAQQQVLIGTAFFPLMTMVIRPLGQALSQLPAFKGDPKGLRAGASFEYYDDTSLLPNAPQAWIYLQERLEEMRDAQAEVAKIYSKKKGYEALAQEFAYVHENMVRTAENFANGMGLNKNND